MSDTGAYSVNSGPLLIRTYVDGSGNNTYLVGKSQQPQLEVPISTNRILITSTNGLLTPSDNIYVSSLTMSSLRGSTMAASTNQTLSVNTSTLVGSTVITSTIQFSSFTGSYLSMNNAVFSESMRGSTIINQNGTFSTLIGQPGATITADNVTFNTSINGMVGSTSLSNVNVKNVVGIGGSSMFAVPNTNANFLSTANLLTNTVSTNVLNANLMSISSMIVQRTTYLTGYESLLVQNWISTASTMAVSTLSGSTLALSSFTTATPIALTFNGYLVTYSSVFAQTALTSTTTICTLSTSIFTTSVGTYSTLAGSSLVTSTLSASTLYVSTSWGSTLNYSTISGSTMTINTLLQNSAYASLTSFCTFVVAPPSMAFIISTANVSTVNASTVYGSTNVIQMDIVSTLTVSTLNTSTVTYPNAIGCTLITSQVDVTNMIFSTLLGSTFTLSTMSASSLRVSSMVASTMNASSLWYSTCNASTLLSQSVTCSTLSGGTVYVSTLYQSSVTCNTMNTATLAISSFTTLTFNASSFVGTLTNPTVNGITFGLGGGNMPQNTALGYQALLVNTSGNYNTAGGYQSLLSSNTGVFDTALGASTFSTITTGSYDTAVGAAAGGVSNGSYCTYVGYAALPSGASVINEHVFGGSATNTTGNMGNGSNSVTIGNSAITKNTLYGSVGIGTLTPQKTLDVRGSSQINNGSVSITNSQPSGSAQFSLLSDGGSGLVFFLNGALYGGSDGTANSATLRNQYGGLRLQPAGGLTNASLGLTILPTGMIGLNQPAPTAGLSVTGSMSVSGSLTITGTLNIISGLLNNSVAVVGSSPWTTVEGNTNIFSATGFVGINTTTTSSYALYVVGTTNVTGFLSVGKTLTTNAFTSGAVNVRYAGITGPLRTSNLICSGITAIGNTITTNDVQSNINGIGIADLSTTFLNGAPVMNYNLYFASQPSALSGGLSVGTSWYVWSNTANTFYIVQPVISGFTYGAYLLNNTNGWNYMSDERIKEDITPLESALDRVLQLKPVTYHMKGMGNNQYVGFVAQDVQPLFPSVVTESSVKAAGDTVEDRNTVKADSDTKGNTVKTDEPPHYLGIHHEGLLPYLVQAFQEQHSMVERHTDVLNSLHEFQWDEFDAKMAELECY